MMEKYFFRHMIKFITSMHTHQDMLKKKINKKSFQSEGIRISQKIRGIPQRYSRFSSKPLKQIESQNFFFFGFPAYKSYVYTILQSIKCAIALCLKKCIFLGIPLWHSGLSIWHRHCSSLGCSCGTGSIPDLGTSTSLTWSKNYEQSLIKKYFYC